MYYLEVRYLVFKYLWVLLFVNSIVIWEHKFVKIWFYGSECGLPWWMFCGRLKRMCILLFLGGVFCRYPLDWVDWECWSGSLYPTKFLTAWSINYQKRVLKSLTIIADFTIYLCSAISFCPTFDTVARCIHVYHYSVFLENWPLHQWNALIYSW